MRFNSCLIKITMYHDKALNNFSFDSRYVEMTAFHLQHFSNKKKASPTTYTTKWVFSWCVPSVLSAAVELNWSGRRHPFRLCCRLRNSSVAWIKARKLSEEWGLDDSQLPLNANTNTDESVLTFRSFFVF